MEDVIIRQKDVDRLAITLLKEIFENLHDEYMLKEYENLEKVRKDFLNKICVNYIDTLYRNYKITVEKRMKLIKPFTDKLIITNENKTYFEKSNNYDSKLVEEAMKDGCIDTQGIYDTLKFLELDYEFGDLYYKMKAFLNIFDVFKSDYTYLKD